MNATGQINDAGQSSKLRRGYPWETLQTTAENRIIAAMSRRSQTAVLERLLAPISRGLNAEAARKLVSLKADAKTQARIDELASKCNEGELTVSERSEYEQYVTAGNLIAILKAKAQLLLADKS